MRQMSRLAVLSFLVVLASSPVFATEDSELGMSDYYPIKVGTTWTYSTSEGDVMVKVMKHEPLGGKLCVRLEATTPDNKKSTEYVRVTDEGVFRHQASDQTIEPPLMFLKNSTKDGDSWTVESNILGKKMGGTYTLKKGSVTIKDKQGKDNKYDDVLIVDSKDFKVDGQDLPHTYYFAKGVGIVKQVVKFGGEEITMELVGFKAGE